MTDFIQSVHSSETDTEAFVKEAIAACYRKYVQDIPVTVGDAYCTDNLIKDVPTTFTTAINGCTFTQPPTFKFRITREATISLSLTPITFFHQRQLATSKNITSKI